MTSRETSPASNGGNADMTPEGKVLWQPSAERIARSNIIVYMQWLKTTRQLEFNHYHDLWQWSVEKPEDFWGSLWEYFRIDSATPYTRVLGNRIMPGAEWFPGTCVNYARHVLRQERADTEALLFRNEVNPLQSLGWTELAGRVRILATQLRKLGVVPGDRVVAYLPNIPETIIAMLAASSIGAIWSACSPDFGTGSVLDRFRQIGPKVLICVDGYRYNGIEFDRRPHLQTIIAGLEDTLQRVICVPYLYAEDNGFAGPKALSWNELMDHAAVTADEFEFEQVAFDHPLWILFTSGTTGLPKPIVQGHGGITLEHLKLITFYMDMKPGERMFFFTTTGWMVWNVLAGALLAGAVPVLYDGNPGYPEADSLWRLAEEASLGFFGTSPTYVNMMRQKGIVPREKYDLSRLHTVMLAGSPASAECMAWFYTSVKEDLLVAPGCGGTDCCTGFIEGIPLLPVHAGEMQVRCLGVDMHAFDENGKKVIGDFGEMVILQPLPSMPLYFWNDTDGQRYRESYFDQYPGVWRQGDFLKINERGGCYVRGRSDATLNRYGIRIGTAEIYRTVSALDVVDDALIVNLNLADGKFFMPLFVKLKAGTVLDDAIREQINNKLKFECSPRHVPDEIHQLDDIPYTLTGKKMEIPVNRILSGVAMEKAVNPDAMRNPESLEYFFKFREARGKL